MVSQIQILDLRLSMHPNLEIGNLGNFRCSWKFLFKLLFLLNQNKLIFMRCFFKLYSLALFKDFLPSYFSSEWSLAQFRVPESRCICAFGSEESTIIGIF